MEEVIMTNKESLEMLNQNCYDMISHCETKISILTAINVGIIGVIFGVYGSNGFFLDSRSNPWFWIFIHYFGFILLMCLVSLFVCAGALISKFSKFKKAAPNPFYYENVAHIEDAAKYLELLNNESENFNSLAEENISLSKVVSRKYKWFNAALRILIHSFTLYISLIIVVIVNCIKNKKGQN